MQNTSNNLRQNIFLYLFFAALFMTGLFIYRDYGLGWDDEVSRLETGYVNLGYVVRNQKAALVNGSEKYHGPAFEMLLVAIERVLHLTDTRDIYHMRHLVLFLFFCTSLIAFYFAAKKLLEHKGYALLASLFLVLSPRIFAESFFNSKDLVSLSAFNIALCSFLYFIEKPNWQRLVAHALASALLIDVRIIGITIPVMTFVTLLAQIAIRKQRWDNAVAHLALYLLLTWLFVIAGWPILWDGPFTHFVGAFNEMRNFPWQGKTWFMGHFFKGSELPWYYLPLWIAVSTPLLYLVFFVCGIYFLIRNLLLSPLKSIRQQLDHYTILVLFAAPILSVVIFHSVVYDSWRHLFYIYPLFIIIAVYGIQALLPLLNYTLALAVYLIIAINSGFLIYWMAYNHPHQNIYFNKMAHVLFEPIKQNFELDYWGLSYKQALEYIINHDPHPLTVWVQNKPGALNMLIQKNEDRKRISIVFEKNDTDYFITNFRSVGGEKTMIEEKPCPVFHKIEVDEVPIMVVYKLK